MTFFIFTYSYIYRALLLFVYIFKGFHPKLKKGFELRKSVGGTPPWLKHRKHTKPIWFHCASGEYEYAKPVIRKIKQDNPQQKIMVTYFSPSVEKALSKATDIDFYCPMPWDTPTNWKNFIEHHQPMALLIARTDLWPSMLWVCKNKNLPRLLFSKTVNINKKGSQNITSGFLYKFLSDIFCVSEQDRKLLYQQIKPYQNIHAAGDTRYDQCLYRVQHPRKLKPLNNFNRPIFTGGSTWGDDEKVLYPLIAKNIKDVSFILAPHEPTEDHLKKIKNYLSSRDIPFQLYSETENWNPQAVLIVDVVGILADLYAWSNFSFIGGSMGRSVHSVMEPLAHGNLCFIGPKHTNNREAMEFKDMETEGLHPVIEVQNSDQLLTEFKQALALWTSNHQLKLKMQLKAKTGASKIVQSWIHKNTSAL